MEKAIHRAYLFLFFFLLKFYSIFSVFCDHFVGLVGVDFGVEFVGVDFEVDRVVDSDRIVEADNKVDFEVDKADSEADRVVDLDNMVVEADKVDFEVDKADSEEDRVDLDNKVDLDKADLDDRVADCEMDPFFFFHIIYFYF